MLEIRSARARHDDVTAQLAALGRDACAAPPAITTPPAASEPIATPAPAPVVAPTHYETAVDKIDAQAAGRPLTSMSTPTCSTIAAWHDRPVLWRSGPASPRG